MEIKLETKIHDLLKEYPFLKEELIRINPKYKKLNNPILRNTIARLASIKQAAAVGGMDPLDLVNKLRAAVGQKPLIKEENTQNEENTTKPPHWIKNPSIVLDANELLDEEKNPLSEVRKALKENEVVLLKADFKPQPLIDEFRRRGYEVYSTQKDTLFLTYIKKPSQFSHEKNL